MKKVFLLYFAILPVCIYAQFFTDASLNLPNNGAKGPSMDVQAADIDGDGDLDILLANEGPPNTLLLNDGNGVFTNGTSGNLPAAFQDSEDVVAGDFDGDGNLDLIFCSEDDFPNGESGVHEYYLGDGEGGFTASSFQFTDSEANAVVKADINGDEKPDVFFGNKGGTGVFINNGDGTFSEENDRVPQINRTTQDLAFADVDNDGDLDLFEGNENGNLLHINDGTGNFLDETTDRLPSGLNIETRKVTFGDVDQDGDVDVFLSNVAFIPGKNRQNRLFINDGSGHFEDESEPRLPFDNDHTIDAIFEDVDLDEDLDLVVANVFGAAIKIYINDGAGIFTDGTMEVLGQNYVRDALGVIAADLNGDGYRDIYVCDRFQSATNRKDLLLLRDAPSSTDSRTNEAASLNVYPNPAQSFINIQTELELEEQVSLLDSTGKVITALLPVKNGIDIYRLDISHLSIFNGLYFLKIGSNEVPVVIEKN